MSQVLEPTGDAGKTYTLASWLPTLRVSGNARPQTTLKEDAITAFLASYTLVTLFWDGLRHNNLTGVDNFFSPPHIGMYLGLTGLGVWIAIVLLRYQKGLDQLEAAGVNEIACLLDFGPATDDMLAQMPRLHELKERAADEARPRTTPAMTSSETAVVSAAL